MVQVNLRKSDFQNLAGSSIFWQNEAKYPIDFGRISLLPIEPMGTTSECELIAEIQRRECLNSVSLEALISDKSNLPEDWRLKILGQPPCIFARGTVYSREYDGKKFVRYITPTNGHGWTQGQHYLSDIWLPQCLSAEWL